MSIERKTISIGEVEVEAFKLEDGSYVYSGTSIAKAIGKHKASPSGKC